MERHFRIIDQVPNRMNTVIGDRAYDDKEVREIIKQRGGRALILPPKNAICHGTDSDRDFAVSAIRALGGDKIAKLRD